MIPYDLQCRGCSREMKPAEVVTSWIKAPLGYTVARTHPGCEHIAATALEGKVVQEPASRKSGKVLFSTAPPPKESGT